MKFFSLYLTSCWLISFNKVNILCVLCACPISSLLHMHSRLGGMLSDTYARLSLFFVYKFLQWGLEHECLVSALPLKIPCFANKSLKLLKIWNQYMSISSSCWRDTSYFLGEYTQDPDHWPLFFSGNTSLWGEPSFSNALICKTNQAEPSRKCMWIWIKGIVLEIDTINPTALSSQSHQIGMPVA